MHAVHIQSNILESIDVMNQQRNDGSYKTSAQLTMYLYTYIYLRGKDQQILIEQNPIKIKVVTELKCINFFTLMNFKCDVYLFMHFL